MNTYLKGAVLLFLGVPGMVFAQKKVLKLELKQAVAKGIEASKHLRMNEEQIVQAQAQWQQARQNQLPSVTATGQLLFLNSPNVQLGIPTSGSGSSGSGITPPNQVMFAAVNASMPIYAGGKLTNGIKAKAFLKKAVELQGKATENEIAENMINAYYNLLKAQKAVRLLQDHLQQAQQRVKDFSNMEKNGLLARNDLMKAQLQQSNAELGLLEAQNNVKVANFGMDVMLGMDTETQLQLDSSITQIQNKASLAQYLEQAGNERMEAQVLDAQAQAAKLQTKAIKGNYLPSLALTGSYVNLKIPNLATVTNALSGGLGLSYNIASLYQNKAKVQESQSHERQLQWQKEALTDQIKVEVYKAYEALEVQEQKIKVFETAVEQADENFRITKNKYDNGLSNTTELLDADTQKLQAHINLEFAKADRNTAYFHLQMVSGNSINELN